MLFILYMQFHTSLCNYFFLLVGSYLIDLDLLQRMLMDLSENEKFKIAVFISELC